MLEIKIIENPSGQHMIINDERASVMNNYNENLVIGCDRFLNQ